MIHFLTGHGGWAPKDGYFELPKNVTVKFYTQNAKLMIQGDVIEIVSGTYAGEPEQVIAPMRTCQNMTLYPDDPHFLTPTRAAWQNGSHANDGLVLFVRQISSLKDLIDHYIRRRPNEAHEFWWCCCRDLSMNATATSVFDGNSGSFVPGVGPRYATDSGINAAQRVTGEIRRFDKQTWAYSDTDFR